jgi:hypothetical protein
MLWLMERYEIQIIGHLDARRARALGCEELHRLPAGDSVVVFTAVDQTALYGVLARLRDTGLALVSVRRLHEPEPGLADRPMQER